MKKIIGSFLILVLSIFPLTQSFAQDAGIACLTIYPCDDDGYLMPEYSNPDSECYEYYASQCKAETTCEDLSGVVKVLTFQNQGLVQENIYLKKKIRVIKRKLRR